MTCHELAQRVRRLVAAACAAIMGGALLAARDVMAQSREGCES